MPRCAVYESASPGRVSAIMLVPLLECETAAHAATREARFFSGVGVISGAD